MIGSFLTCPVASVTADDALKIGCIMRSDGPSETKILFSIVMASRTIFIIEEKDAKELPIKELQ